MERWRDGEEEEASATHSMFVPRTELSDNNGCEKCTEWSAREDTRSNFLKIVGTLEQTKPYD